MVAALGDNDNYFAGFGVADVMPLNGTLKSFSYSFSAQAWINCFHTFRHNIKHEFLFFCSLVFYLAVFPVEQVSNILTVILTKTWNVFAKLCTNEFQYKFCKCGINFNCAPWNMAANLTNTILLTRSTN